MTLAAIAPDYDMKSCPFCFGARVRMIQWQRMYRVRCLELRCGAEGPKRHDEQEAMDAWNERQRHDIRS